ncbi:hypothetical protein PODOV050v2_p0014 [Vibrio phage 66E30.1]|nr:hypothetical protein PODOV053v2_p0014 [Vibrio phage 24E30.2]QZI91282.1 hypothetical protein PODOV052v2_p0014 [Vibrio phage 24E35.2]QZI91445.1 hypothetical protein PODOV048v2_p0014 [Vibrio phage 34E29.1]QZI91482.1 hypothetical protein PODOV007v2_p0014 [Vibrio phage 36E38.1]QZI91751.1 hypothetical protein PODOV008v2_p0014 [Vibrio phage 44E38.1]QZI91788.1 hypothetical protein PODOV046v2_p0014 [Vibrio phage 44E38.2]QZI91978.1 hypothetical protein PODOV051v2_p0014 [Vibrio phage 64E30.1]QZI9201
MSFLLNDESGLTTEAQTEFMPVDTKAGSTETLVNPEA